MKKTLLTLAVSALCYSANAQITFTDDFNRADGSLGANWTSSLNATANSVVSNEYAYNGSGASAGAFTPASLTTTFSASGDFRLEGNGGAGLAFNIHNGGDSLYFVNIFGGTSFLQIAKYTDGAIAGLVFAEVLSSATNATDFYEMALNVTAPGVMGITITNTVTSAVLYDDTYTDATSPFSGGNAGFYMGGTTPNFGDNFSVTVVPEPGSVGLIFAAGILGLLYFRKRRLSA